VYPFCKLFLVGLFCIGTIGQVDGLFAEDELAAKSDQPPATKQFPLAVQLLGYTQRSGSTAVLISVTRLNARVETYILNLGIKKAIMLDDVPKDEPAESFKDASDAIFLQVHSVETDNRTVLLGFPDSLFKSKTIRMAD